MDILFQGSSYVHYLLPSSTGTERLFSISLVPYPRLHRPYLPRLQIRLLRPRTPSIRIRIISPLNLRIILLHPPKQRP